MTRTTHQRNVSHLWELFLFSLLALSSDQGSMLLHASKDGAKVHLNGRKSQTKPTQPCPSMWNKCKEKYLHLHGGASKPSPTHAYSSKHCRPRETKERTTEYSSFALKWLQVPFGVSIFKLNLARSKHRWMISMTDFENLIVLHQFSF